MSIARQRPKTRSRPALTRASLAARDARGEDEGASSPERTHPDPTSTAGPTAPPKNRWLLVTVAVAGVVCTLISSVVAGRSIQDGNAHEVREAATVTGLQVERRVDSYVASLRGLRGLFEASDEVNETEFAAFLDSAVVFERLPGVQGFSWNPRVDVADVETFELEQRRQLAISAPDAAPYSVRPETDQTDRYPIRFLAPLEGNEGAYGFDIGSEPTRREAIERALITNDLAASGPIELIVESGGPQPGMLILAPLSDKSGRETTGFVTAAFHIGDLLDGAVSLDGIEYTVADTGLSGSDAAESTLIFSTVEGPLPDNADAVVFDVAGRRWEVSINPSSVPRDGPFAVVVVVLAGLALTAALTSLVRVSMRSQEEAERKAALLTRDLRAANVDIRRSNADLEKFAYVASHDLQTPARNVKNIVELLRADLPADLDTDTLDLLDHLSVSAERMEELIQGLLEFSRIHREGPVAEAEVDLGDAVAAAISGGVLDSLAETPRIVVDALPAVPGNERLLTQVFENLIGNAVKYRAVDRPVEIRISAHQVGSIVTVSVEDNGIGIDPKFHDRVFEMFRRLHRADEYEGSGIGLALCRKIVERHGGEIWVESELGEGSTFVFTLVAAAEPHVP